MVQRADAVEAQDCHDLCVFILVENELKSIREGERDREGYIYIYIFNRERETEMWREKESAAIMDADHPRCLPVDLDRLISITFLAVWNYIKVGFCICIHIDPRLVCPRVINVHLLLTLDDCPPHNPLPLRPHILLCRQRSVGINRMPILQLNQQRAHHRCSGATGTPNGREFSQELAVLLQAGQNR
jgi:hypothetical protein